MTTALLSPADLEEFGRELDSIRDEVIAGLGEEDARYIRGVIATQRKLELAGRALLFASWLPPAWLAGTATLATAKILENMEIGHNVLHGQWDWMRDPKVHSTTWEWDTASPADQWKHSHNFIHHTFTYVLGKDRDIGYSLLRVSPEQRWRPVYLLQPIYNMLLAMDFEYGIAIYDLEVERIPAGDKSPKEAWTQLRAIAGKVRRQVTKDYLAFPVLAGLGFLPVLLGNLTANLARNVWAHTIIFCGHFPEGAQVFTEDQLEGETRGEWYVRQLLGSCNIDGGNLLHLMSGNLSHQIEHHLFPDLPSNRYAPDRPANPRPMPEVRPPLQLRLAGPADRFGLQAHPAPGLPRTQTRPARATGPRSPRGRLKPPCAILGRPAKVVVADDASPAGSPDSGRS